MNGSTMDIPIDLLHLHLNNPRCLFTSSEEDALYELIADQGGSKKSNKLLALAIDIAKNGLSPTDLIMVKPAGNGFTVREGNRRVASIKCSLDSGIIPNEFSSLADKFSALSGSMPTVITCHVTDDDKEINRIINLKHNGQNGGAGTIPWNSEQRARFDEIISGKPDKALVLADYLMRHFGPNSDETRYIAKCSKTNLERMLSSPYVREKLGFSLSNSTYKYIGKNDALLSLFLRKLSETRVGDIYYVDDRKKFIDDLLEELTGAQPDTPAQLTLPNFEQAGPCDDMNEDFWSSSQSGNRDASCRYENTSDSQLTPAEQYPAPRPKSHPNGRRTVAPQSGCPLHTEGKPNLSQLHTELKTLTAEETPMACGLVFRTLIEKTVDWYLDRKQINYKSSSSSSGRIQEACNQLVQDKKSGIENNDVDYLRKFAQNKDSIPVTLSSLNSIAHGSSGYPDANSLISLWDKIYGPLRAMLDYGRTSS